MEQRSLEKSKWLLIQDLFYLQVVIKNIRLTSHLNQVILEKGRICGKVWLYLENNRFGISNTLSVRQRNCQSSFPFLSRSFKQARQSVIRRLLICHYTEAVVYFENLIPHFWVFHLHLHLELRLGRETAVLPSATATECRLMLWRDHQSSDISSMVIGSSSISLWTKMADLI